MFEYSVYTSQNTHESPYEDQPVSAMQGNNFWGDL